MNRYSPFRPHLPNNTLPIYFVRYRTATTSSQTHLQPSHELVIHEDGAGTSTSTSPSSEESSSSENVIMASEKIFADALKEESETVSGTSPSRLSYLQAEHENWTGEENIRDAVLRMLVDKYKPLRGPTIRSADEKLHTAPPQVSGDTTNHYNSAQNEYKPDWQKRAMEPLLPAVEGHRPWHTTFSAPSHAVAPSIKAGSFYSSTTDSSVVNREGTRSLGVDEGKNIDISSRRRSATATRLGNARESTIDYKLGIKGKVRIRGTSKRSIPTGVKAWASVVEERIEVIG